MCRGPWLRSLRAPVFGLNAPIDKDYRGVDSAFSPWTAATGAPGTRYGVLAELRLQIR